MKKNTFLIVAAIIVLTSCVTQTEHDRIISENIQVSEERDRLKQELEDIKFGAPSLLAAGLEFFEAGDYQRAREKFQMLIDKHPGMPQTIEAKKHLSSIEEEELWNSASISDDITFTESYISKFPNGKYIIRAKSRRVQLKELNMVKAYEAAKQQNTASAWKIFLEQYPNHVEAEAIRKKIIRLEVSEIMGDRETGQIPSFDRFNTSFSSNSSVEITNNTGCELTVRYSGPDVEMVAIPSGATRTVYLSSGSYRIAATACGANYAGTETLQGQYGSRYYITRSRF